MSEWWTFFAGALFGAGIGWTLGGGRATPSEPRKPRECDHFWTETLAKDAIIWSCSKCATSKVELFSELTAAARAANKQAGI